MTNVLYNALFSPLRHSREAFLHLPEGTAMSGAAFWALCVRAANAFVDAGIRPGDRIAVQVQKSPEALALYGGAVAAGAVFLPLNTAYTATEMSYFLKDSGASLLVADMSSGPEIQTICDELGITAFTLDENGQGTMTDLIDAQPDKLNVVERNGDDLAAILYTSGTTGRSKGAMLTHDNLLSNAAVLAKLWQFTSEDCLLHALPIFHTHGLFVATNVSLLARSSMIFLPKFDLNLIFQLLPKATVLMGVPTFYTRMIEDPRLSHELTSGMRLFISGSAPLLKETHIEFFERSGHRILERYGMTETNMNTSNPYLGERRPGTVGYPLPEIEIKISDPDSGVELERGSVGMIEVRGPNVFKGYWQMPQKTAEELRPDGFFITGDLGRFDEDGYLHIVGRQKDLIISGGYNIYPKEIELVLDECPDVLESAVIGVPQADMGEAVLGIIVALPGRTPDIEAIMNSLKGKLARFKQPREILLVNELPRNAMGKVQKALLRERFARQYQR
ncbi:malonate--CoA ligase [Pelagibacterium lacus]|uniref:Malonyl-CoA synthase n=1 Tax=Pelagibacterium lacus TaxID=2282655 RepID=A0A369W4N3_9HYPH|nr:malonyl-CoA synthase [Pelagibacterium lacus]RDE08222.1 malonyl-CoA synthase [Pelagibacterium lacus]